MTLVRSGKAELLIAEIDGDDPDLSGFDSVVYISRTGNNRYYLEIRIPCTGKDHAETLFKTWTKEE